MVIVYVPKRRTKIGFKHFFFQFNGFQKETVKFFFISVGRPENRKSDYSCNKTASVAWNLITMDNLWMIFGRECDQISRNANHNESR